MSPRSTVVGTGGSASSAFGSGLAPELAPALHDPVVHGLRVQPELAAALRDGLSRRDDVVGGLAPELVGVLGRWVLPHIEPLFHRTCRSLQLSLEPACPKKEYRSEGLTERQALEPRADRPRGQAALPGLPAQGAPARRVQGDGHGPRRPSCSTPGCAARREAGAREIKELSKKARRHRDAIVRAVGLGLSNARAQAVSNKIKLTVRMGYGFRNVDNLIALVMLRCSNLPIELPGRL